MIDVKELLEAGKKLGTLAVEEVNGIPCAFVNGQIVALGNVLDIADARAEWPRALKGTATLALLESFCAHVNRFKDDASAIFADPAKHELVAIHDYSIEMGKPRWGRHRTLYTCPLSRQWKAWTEILNKPLTQEEFADFIEANINDVKSSKTIVGDAPQYPRAGELINMARKLTIKTKGEFERTIDETTGEYTMVNKLEHEKPSSTKIHPRFLISIPTFERGNPYTLEVYVRFTLSGARPSFVLLIPSAKDIYEEAFKDVYDKAAVETGLPVFVGKPE